MKLIVGLGNPGKKFINTKHNVGFRATDTLACKYNVRLKRKLFNRAKQANISALGQEILLIQPLTYMNLSGTCILDFYKKLKIDLKDLLIICDDISLPLGKIRIRASGSAGGHNGLASIIGSLDSENFARLRIGIADGNQPTDNLSEYVLSQFTKGQEEIINEVIDNVVLACESWLKDGIEITMNKFN